MSIPLILTEDGFEAVRNAVANILVNESVAQQAAAVQWNEDNPDETQLDPDDWALDVYLERIDPNELYRDDSEIDTQVVNVWFETSNDNDNVSSQTNSVCMSQINVDCIAAATSENTDAGHDPGDEKSYLRCQRVARLCRRILMDPSYHRLGLEDVVRTRKMSLRRQFPPNSINVPDKHVAGIQLQFDVRHNETFDFEELDASEGALVKIYREPGGKLMASADFDWT